MVHKSTPHKYLELLQSHSLFLVPLLSEHDLWEGFVSGSSRDRFAPRYNLVTASDVFMLIAKVTLKVLAGALVRCPSLHLPLVAPAKKFRTKKLVYSIIGRQGSRGSV